MTETVLFIETADNLDIGDAIDCDGTVTIVGKRDLGQFIELTIMDDFGERDTFIVEPDHEFSVMGVVD